MLRKGAWYYEPDDEAWARKWDGRGFSGRVAVTRLRAVEIHRSDSPDTAALRSRLLRASTSRADDDELTTHTRRRHRGLAALAIVVVSLLAVGLTVNVLTRQGGTVGPPASQPAGADDGTDSADAPSYGDRSCDYWNGDMDEGARFTMSADMLVALRQDDGYSGVLERSLVLEYESAISSACAAATGDAREGPVTAAVLVYNTEPRFGHRG